MDSKFPFYNIYYTRTDSDSSTILVGECIHASYTTNFVLANIRFRRYQKMTTENIEWVSKTGLLSSFRSQLEQLLAKPFNECIEGRIYQLKQIIDEIERA